MKKKISNNVTRGVSLFELGDTQAAKRLFTRAIRDDPSNPLACYLSGLSSARMGNFGEACKLIETALFLRPRWPDAIYNLAVVYEKLFRFDEAVQAYRSLLEVEPDHLAGLNNLGDIYFRRQDSSLALKYFDAALSINPFSPEVLVNRGYALLGLGELLVAMDSFEKALLINESHPFALGALISLKMKLCEWTSLEVLINKVHKRVLDGEKCAEPLVVAGIFDCPRTNLLASKIFSSHLANGLTSVKGGSASAKVGLDDTERLVIGYFSSDFREHAVSRLIVEVIESHTRTAFEVCGFYYGPATSGEFSSRVCSAFDKFYVIREMGDEAVQDLCKKIRLKIAIDLNGHTQMARTSLFLKRLAPIQVNYLGFPGTMGSDSYDYILADSTTIPENLDDLYLENVVRLPGCYQPNDSKKTTFSDLPLRQSVGLPNAGIVFCCFNSSWKILPEVFRDWMSILKQVEGSVLWLLEDNPTASDNLVRYGAKCGVPKERFIFAKRTAYTENLARQSLADLFLDTYPYNAHTTASDALWAGVPVITRVGSSFPSRVGASLLKEVGLGELITEDRTSYISLAVALGLNQQRLAGLKRRLAETNKRTPLFKGKAAAAKLERAYARMYSHAKLRLGPAPFDVT